MTTLLGYDILKIGCFVFALTEKGQYSASAVERFSYDLEIKTREQNRNNKRMEIQRFNWFIKRIQTPVYFGWLSERSGEKT